MGTYIKSFKMGSLVVEKILAGVAAVILMVVVGAIGYKELSPHDVTVVVDLKEGESPRSLMIDDGVVTTAKQSDLGKNEYILTVKPKNKGKLLNWLRRSSKVENVKVTDE